MHTIHPYFITDSTGKKISAVIPIEEYKTLMGALEDVEDIRLYDESKGDHEPSIPVDDAFAIIEAKRKGA